MLADNSGKVPANAGPSDEVSDAQGLPSCLMALECSIWWLGRSVAPFQGHSQLPLPLSTVTQHILATHWP